MEDSPEQDRPTPNTAQVTCPSAPQSIDADESKMLADRMTSMQAKVEEQFGNIATQFRVGQVQQNNNIATTDDTLAASLQNALQALNMSQKTRSRDSEERTTIGVTAEKEQRYYDEKCGTGTIVTDPTESDGSTGGTST